MTYLRQLDILVELIDLCHEIIGGLRHQLGFYRASVYKIENHTEIKAQVDDLSVLLRILGDPDLTAFLAAFQRALLAKPVDGGSLPPPGESPFSFELGLFLCGIDQALKDFYQQITFKCDRNSDNTEIRDLIRINRKTLLTLCKKDSKQYQFFQSL